jgi:hypothetical protein
MKAPDIFQMMFTLFLLSVTCLNVNSQKNGYHVSSDTLIAGDTAIYRYGVGYYNPDGLKAVLTPHLLFYPWNCPVCKDDSIFSYRTELYSDSIYDFYFAVPMGTIPGIYRPAFLFEENFVVWGKHMNIYTPPFIYQQPEDKMVCSEDTVVFELYAMGNDVNDLYFQWYHNDIIYNDYYKGDAIITNPQLQDTGRYYCVIGNSFGVDTSYVVRLDLFALTINPGTPVGPAIFCPGTESTAYSILSDPLATGYQWQLLPEISGTIEQYDTSAIIFWYPGFSGIAELYVDVMSDICGAISSDVLEITIPGLSPPPEICIIGTDEETGKYQIVWEKSGIESAQLFRIYRESNMADVYLEIGSIDPGELCVFIDPTSAPKILSHRYKISYIDSCGKESELSDYHQTMHLAANLGIDNVVNLAWSEYKGIPFPTYDLYRGNYPDSMNLLIQVPSTVTSFTDDDPPSGTIYYQVGMSNPSGCNPAKKAGSNYSSSRSNLVKVYISGIEEINEDHLFAIYPNPVDEELQIHLKNVLKGEIHYNIYNSMGTLVLEGMIPAGSANVDVKSLSPGLYIIIISAEREIFFEKFVVARKSY